MGESPARMWQLMTTGSEELAEVLGLEAPPPVFTPSRALPAVDAWLAGHKEPLDAEELAMLGFLLARVLVETHAGGLVEIRGHALEGEWAVTGFERGLARDFHVPFMVSASRIGFARNLTAVDWYKQCLAEGKRGS
jgi:hypothetical protein